VLFDLTSAQRIDANQARRVAQPMIFRVAAPSRFFRRGGRFNFPF
jgi:hypothetical protein